MATRLFTNQARLKSLRICAGAPGATVRHLDKQTYIIVRAPLASFELSRQISTQSSTPKKELKLSRRSQSTFTGDPAMTEVRPGLGPNQNTPPPPPLAILPTSHLLRALLITSVTTSPLLSTVLTKILLRYSKILARIPITSAILKTTFYSHFCAGTSKAEIDETVGQLREWGFGGVILAYAREVESGDEDLITEEENLKMWKDGTMKTIEYSAPQDFVAIKYTGAGISFVKIFEQDLPIPDNLASALDEICAYAQSRRVRLLFDAEQQCVQHAMDKLTQHLMSKYNPAKYPPTVYNTYQMYLKASQANLTAHIAQAKAGSYSFGAKLVRGAYLHTDPRELIHDTKEDTDASYDRGIETVLTENGENVNLGLVVASHNRDSVERARALLKKIRTEKEACAEKDVTFAQLMGMADEVSLELVAQNRCATMAEGETAEKIPMADKAQAGMNVVKYVPWGSLEECIKYLLRRADENKDSLSRTFESRRAVSAELWRRMFG